MSNQVPHTFVPDYAHDPSLCGYEFINRNFCGQPCDAAIHQVSQAPPERIRVVVRAGKADWIGIAYAPNAPRSDAIVEYIEKSAADAELTKLREALQGLGRDKQNVNTGIRRLCWCSNVNVCVNEPECTAARAALQTGE